MNRIINFTTKYTKGFHKEHKEFNSVLCAGLVFFVVRKFFTAKYALYPKGISPLLKMSIHFTQNEYSFHIKRILILGTMNNKKMFFQFFLSFLPFGLKKIVSLQKVIL
jgi:hypothetical protein